MTWNMAFVYGWLTILCILAGYEFFALFVLFLGAGYEPPLTHVVCRYVPWYVTLPFIAWLFYHFAVRYANASYLQHLRTGK